MLYEQAPRNPPVSPAVIRSVQDLMTALELPDVPDLRIEGLLEGVPTLRLRPGQALRAAATGAGLRFLPGHDGVRLCRDNALVGLALLADPDRRAVFNTDELPNLGRLSLSALRVTGQVQILAAGALRAGHVDVDGLDIEAADTRLCSERPRGFGVEVLQGAFTLWNRQQDSTSVISARLKGLSAGRAGAPVLGGGILVSGGGFEGGRVVATVLETGVVHSHGMIAAGTADRISGGVFNAHGAFVGLVRNQGTVVTYGPNDMVLDNWGTVNDWIAEAPLTSYGPSAIGVVNFGTLHALDVRAPIETFGQGARGFNVYDGKLGRALFDRITTHGDGAVGVQISQPIARLVVRRGIETLGGTGPSLVKGRMAMLSATGLSIKPGGMIGEVEIGGGLLTRGPGIPPLELQGEAGSFRVSGGFVGGPVAEEEAQSATAAR
ncbi:MAG: hypothetical protein J0M00_15790 [Burkholderiales bacterium]|nr:hypothetical protein [Burkholderiales bacterium]